MVLREEMPSIGHGRLDAAALVDATARSVQIVESDHDPPQPAGEATQGERELPFHDPAQSVRERESDGEYFEVHVELHLGVHGLR